MENILFKLNKLRVLRNILYMASIVFCLLIMVFNQFLVQTEWLYVLILFDDLLIFVGCIFIIEGYIGHHYDVLYRESFLEELFKTMNSDYIYRYRPRTVNKDIMETKIFDFDSELYLKHEVDTPLYTLYDGEIYIHTIRERKITQFKGYIIVFKKQEEIKEKGLVLYHKKLYLGQYKLLKKHSFNKYKVYGNKSCSNQIFQIDALKQFLTKYPKDKYYICLLDDIIVFKFNKMSYFRKPVFKKIDEAYLHQKISEFKRISLLTEELYDTIKLR